MKLEQNRIDDLNLQVTLTVSAEDYADSRKKKLNDYRRKAEFKGFRKGMVPMSLVEKMYGQQALGDSVNDVISTALNDFIQENNLKVLGEPLPSEDNPENTWEAGADFTFKFDIAQNPEVSFELSKDDEIIYYTITVTEEAKNEMKNNLLRQYGSLEEGETAKEEDFIIVDFEQGETKVEGTYVALRNVAEAARASFVGVKAGDVLDVNVNEAFENETDRASMLKVSKEELAQLDPMFKMTVTNVKTFVNAPLTASSRSFWTVSKLSGAHRSNGSGRTGTETSSFSFSSASRRRAMTQISSTLTYSDNCSTNSRPMPELAPVTMAMFMMDSSCLNGF